MLGFETRISDNESPRKAIRRSITIRSGINGCCTGVKRNLRRREWTKLTQRIVWTVGAFDVCIRRTEREILIWPSTLGGYQPRADKQRKTGDHRGHLRPCIPRKEKKSVQRGRDRVIRYAGILEHLEVGD